MRWQELRTHWEELDDRTRTRLVAIVRERIGVTKDGVEISVETWAANLDVELEDLMELESLGEATRHPGPNDVHEQREDDQEAEGVLHWPPHVVGRRGSSGPPGMP